jgi:hypothetical protein
LGIALIESENEKRSELRVKRNETERNEEKREARRAIRDSLYIYEPLKDVVFLIMMVEQHSGAES